MLKQGNAPAQRSSQIESVQQNARPVVPPPVDIYENKEEILLFADMPGVQTSDVFIHLDKGELTLQGRRGQQEPGKALVSELPDVDYRRTFAVQGVDADKIEAVVAFGVLKVRLPKSEAVKPRQIAVKSG